MLLNGPEYDGVYGSLFEVILKQRPQASPEAELAPNANVLTAAVYPDVFMPHAVKDVAVSVDSMDLENGRRAYRERYSPNTP
jgi:hypothetical protein